MRNNEYTATPNWFSKNTSDNSIEDNLSSKGNTYYIGGSSGDGIYTLNFYNKYIKLTHKIIDKDLYLKDNAILAVDSRTPELIENPETKTDLGKVIPDKDWHSSTFLRVLGKTKLTAKFKANIKKYGLVFFDKYNLPISGYTPVTDGEVILDVPENAFYFRVCHYIQPIEPPKEGEQKETKLDALQDFYVLYEGIDLYSTENSDKAYQDGFLNFTQPSTNVKDGLNTDSIKGNTANILLLQPLGYTIDKENNIRITFDLDFLDSSLMSKDFVTTLKDDPLDVLSVKSFKKGLNINDKLIHEKNGVIYIEADIAVKGGVTTYALGERKPSDIMDGVVADETTITKNSGKLSVTDSLIQQINEGGGIKNIVDGLTIGANAVTRLELSPDGKTITYYGNTVFATQEWVKDKKYVDALALEEKLKGYVTIDTTQDIKALKYFNSGLILGSSAAKSTNKLYNKNGITYLDGDLAVTGGIVTYALGNRDISTIMDGVYVDGVTIKKINNQLVVSGAGNSFDETAMWKALKTVDPTNLIDGTHLLYVDNYFANKIHTHKIGDINGLWDKLNVYDTHVVDTTIHVTNLEKIDWNNHIKDNTIHVTLKNKDYWDKKADRTYVDDNFVTLATDLTITGDKYFNNDLYLGTSSSNVRLYYNNGVAYIDGDLAVTGGITTYALGNRNISTIMDGVYVDGKTIKKNIYNLLEIIGGGSSSFDESQMWSALGGSINNKLIDKTHLTTALDGYLTKIPYANNGTIGGILIGYSENGKNYAVKLFQGKAYVNVPWEEVEYKDKSGNENYKKIGELWINGESRYTVYCIDTEPNYDNHYVPSESTSGSAFSASAGNYISKVYYDANKHVTGIGQGALPSMPSLDKYWSTDNFTSSDISHWNTAWDNEHTHSNMNALNTFSLPSNSTAVKCSKSFVSSGEVTAYSDRRLKSNIKPLLNRGSVLPVTYIKDGKESIGFIALDILKIYPELVLEDDSENKYLSVNYAQYTAVLQALIIEQNKRIEKLEKELTKIKNNYGSNSK